MKAILEFSLPEETDEFKRAVRTSDVFCAVSEFGEYLRGQERHGDPPEDIHRIRARWFEVFGDLLELP